MADIEEVTMYKTIDGVVHGTRGEAVARATKLDDIQHMLDHMAESGTEFPEWMEAGDMNPRTVVRFIVENRDTIVRGFGPTK